MRRLITLGTPAAFALVTLVHPRPGPAIVASLAPQAGLWIAVHLAQLVLIALLGFTIWLLLEDLPGLPAAVSRCALGFFVCLYAAFDALVGLGTGVLIQQTAALGGADKQVARQIIQGFWAGRLDVLGPVFWVTLTADLAWIIAMLFAAAAHRRAGAPAWAVGLLVVAGAAFAIDHTWPAGTIGMLALLGAAAGLTASPAEGERRRSR